MKADMYISKIVEIGILEKNSTNEKIIISNSPFIIGRYSKTSYIKPDYCLESKMVSRIHLKIYQREYSGKTIFEVCDEYSLNGTWINGQRIRHNEMIRIKDGDELRIVSEEFIFHIIEEIKE